MFLISNSFSGNNDFFDSIPLKMHFISANYFQFHIVGKLNDAYTITGVRHGKWQFKTKKACAVAETS